MRARKAVNKAVFSIIIATIVLAVMVPFLSFLVTAFYSANEIYTIPRSILPKTKYDIKVEYQDDMYYISVYEDRMNDYELKIYSGKIEKLRRYLQTKYSVMLTDEEVIKDFSPSQNGEPVYLEYKKDLLYNFRTFFTITNGAEKSALNSLTAAGWTILISLSIGSLTGYTLARFRIKFKKKINMMLLLVRMFPAVAISIPMLVILIKMGLSNTMIGLAIVYSVGNIALTAWITNSIFKGISVELEEASLVFGANRLQTFFRITLPLAFPGLVACSMYAFLAAWNDSITALILANNNPTLSLLIYKAIGSSGEIQLAAAGALIQIAPALVFTFIIKNYINQLWGNVKL